LKLDKFTSKCAPYFSTKENIKPLRVTSKGYGGFFNHWELFTYYLCCSGCYSNIAKSLGAKMRTVTLFVLLYFVDRGR